MTNRELIRYMLAACGLWLLTYWRRILLGIVLVVVVLLLTSCVVGPLPTPQPAGTPTPAPTNTAIALPTEVTPTLEEPLCNPKYSATIFIGFADVFANPGLTIKMTDEAGHPLILKYGREVLLLETSEYSYRVVTRYGERIDGWIPYFALPVECR